MTTLKQALDDAMIAIKADVPVMLWSPPGCGKSEGLDGRARAEGYGFLAETLGTMESVDLRGLPGQDGQGGVKWSRPDFLIRLDAISAEFSHTLVVFLIDEINANNQSVQVPCMQLIRARHIGPHRLPENVRIVAAGNHLSDRAAAQRMGTALANRLCHLTVDSPATPEGVKEFCQWGAVNNVHPMMLALMMLRGAPTGAPGTTSYQPGLLHWFDPANANAKAYPSPRSVVEASKFCDAPAGSRMRLIAGCCGEGFATEAEGFFRVYAQLPPILSIVSDPSGARLPSEPSAMYAVTFALARAATPSNFSSVLTYMARLGGDFTMACVTDAIRRTPALTSTAPFIQWAAANGVA